MTGIISITISKDMMTATATVEHNQQFELNKETIMTVLESNGIKTGVDQDAIDTILRGEAFDTEIVIARGKEAVPGSDAHYEFTFDTDKKEYKPQILEDGSVDYSFQRQLVKAGDVVARFVPAKPGFFGYTLFADVVAPVPSKGCRELDLSGAEKVDDEVRALIDGEVRLNGNTLSVVDYLSINGNASNVMGDIVYKGDIHIKGDVYSGTRIIASGNVFVDGDVEAASIEAGKDIIVKKGVHGQQRALLKANGSVCAYFIEEATIIAGDQVRFNYSYNSHIFSLTDVIAEGRYGAVVGGDVEARNSIVLNSAGNEAEVSTILKIEPFEGEIKQRSAIIIQKHLFKGVEIRFGENATTYREQAGEYHFVHGLVKYYEIGTFVEEVEVVRNEVKKKTILLVDDEPIILKTFYTYLKNDYNVLAVPSAKEAFKVLDKTMPDLLLLDYNMPVMDGGQMLEQIRRTTWREYHDVPVIFASAVTDKDIVRKCLSLYPQGYLVKPLGERDLKDVLSKFFAKRG